MSFDPMSQPLHGAHAIEASAGTGKTYSITLLWLRLIVEEGLGVDRILVTTFTKAATAELQERLREALMKASIAAQAADPSLIPGPEAQVVARFRPHLGTRNLAQEIALALSSFDLAPICTIHGFCQSLIQRHSLELGCDPAADVLEDCSSLLQEEVTDQCMGLADTQQLDLGKALRATQAVVSNPTARLLAVIDESGLARRQQAVRSRWEPRIGTLSCRSTTREALRNKVQSLDPSLSEAQATALGNLAQAWRDEFTAVSDAAAAAEVAPYHCCATGSSQRLARRLDRSALRTYDDIPLTIHRAIRSDHAGTLRRAVRTSFPAAIIDECQDSDATQIGVFQPLFLEDEGGRPAPGVISFTVIGDPKQSIYRFRGADLGSYQQLAGRMTRAAPMGINHRSDPALVAAINDLYLRQPSFANADIGIAIRYETVEAAAHEARLNDPGATGALAVHWSPETERPVAKRDLARQMAQEFRRLLTNGTSIVDRASKATRRLQASNLAVLASDHADLRRCRQALQEVGLPCQMAGKSLGSVWSTDEAMDVLAWLEAIDALEHRRDPLSALLAFAATPLGGQNGASLQSLQEDPILQQRWTMALKHDQDGIRLQGPLPVLLSRIGSGTVLGTLMGERWVTNWRQIGSRLQGVWATGRHQSGDLARWLEQAVAGQESEGEDDLVRLETDLPAVQLVTIHTAKGLEYPVVACPFLWHLKSRQKRSETKVAVVRSTGGTILDLGSPDFRSNVKLSLLQEDEELERICYVALTRARHRLYLGMAGIKEGGRNHQNGSERTPIAKLLGVADLPWETWGEALAGYRLGPTGAGTALDVPPGAVMTIQPPPPLTVKGWTMERVASYSSLAKHASDDAWLRDHEDGPAVVPKAQPGLLAGLGGGSVLGNQVHADLEAVLGNGRALDEVLRGRPPAWEQALGTILGAPLLLDVANPSPITLSGLAGQALAEMHFLMPVRELAPSSLAKALQSDPALTTDPEDRAWTAGIPSWTFANLRGHLQGYIDLICEHAGRWYVIDYKTNQLPSYGARALDAAMRQQDYLLQAWVYTLALHRHLKAHCPGYDYDTHVGGCVYLFVRGFPTEGVWSRRPARTAIEALDALLVPRELDP